MFNPDFKEFIKLLNDNKVNYLIVGGYAVGFYGYQRYTGDIDVWLDISVENAGKVESVLKQFGFKELGLSAKDFLKEDQIIQLGYPPNRIDLLTSIDGVVFMDCFNHFYRIFLRVTRCAASFGACSQIC